MLFRSWDVNLARPYIVKASEELIELFRKDTIKGVTISAPGFYGPQGRVLRLGLAMPDMNEKFESFRFNDSDGSELKITNYEMEGSAIAALAHHLGHKAITVCCVIANRYLKEVNIDYHARIDALIKLVLDKVTE